MGIDAQPTPDTRRITVSLPADLLRALDEKLVNGAGTRGAVIRRLIEDALREREARDRRAAEERALDEHFARAYREQPETEEEFGWHDPAVRRYATEEPWE
jgi:metal-responsive CopG/Arc/MetJ family transcriptional regulator